MDTMDTPIKKTISFADFNLNEKLLKSLEKMGFTAPTPIQMETIPTLLNSDKDFIGLASTGTGKTAAFAIPLIEKIDFENSTIQSLILCPTRELCLQVADQVQKIGEVSGLRTLAIIGGDSYRKQRDGLRRNPHVVISTPGRLIDLIEQGMIDLSTIQYLILDEADEMISIGFREALDQILSSIRSEKSDNPTNKIWLFSATMSSDIRKVASQYLKDHESVQINRETPLSGTVEQIYYTVQDKNKLETLSRILAVTHPFYGIIFCQTKQEVADVTALLQKRGFAVESLHGDKQQKEREWILKKFKSKEITVVVATDVAARGLDIKDLTHVINYNLPWDIDSYIHRIGRTGRNGQKGQALTLTSPRELKLLRRIQSFTKTTLQKADIPTADQVALFKIGQILNSILKTDLSLKKIGLTEDLVKEVAENLQLDFNSETTKFITRFVLSYHPELIIEKENFLDYSPGRIPDEMMIGSGGGKKSSSSFKGSRDRAERSSRSDRGPRRERSDRDSSDRPARRSSFAGESSRSEGRPRRFSNENEDFAPRERKDRGPRYDDTFKPERSSRKDNESSSRGENKRPAGFRPRSSDSGAYKSSSAGKKDHSGIKRVRSR